MADDLRDHLGIVRKLGRTPTPKGMLRGRGATNIQDYRTAAGLPPLIPRSEWKPISFVQGAPTSLIEDQRQYGSCSCATETGAQNRQRWMRGVPFVPLAWTWLYDQVNGGHDSGSNMGEVGSVARAQGVPPMSSYPDCQFRSGNNPAGVPYYREGVQEITFSSFDEYATGILMGLCVQHAIDAGGRFESFDSSGVSKGQGGNANHSVYSAGLQQVNGAWVLETVNSWTASWGPFGSGYCLTTERQLMNVAAEDDGVGHIVVLAPAGVQDAAPAPH